MEKSLRKETEPQLSNRRCDMCVVRCKNIRLVVTSPNYKPNARTVTNLVTSLVVLQCELGGAGGFVDDGSGCGISWEHATSAGLHWPPPHTMLHGAVSATGQPEPCAMGPSKLASNG